MRRLAPSRVSSIPDRDALRRQLRDRRRAVPPAQRIAAAEALANHLLGSTLLPSAGYVAGYWSMDGEIGLHALQLRLPPALIYCLPILHRDRSLRFAPWRASDPLVTNRYGIPEPDLAPESALSAAQMAMIVLPLVGFDAAGNRLGMGGGWYDRSLAFRAGNALPLLVGAAFALQRIDALTPQPWDVRLDAVCTEAGLFLAKESA